MLELEVGTATLATARFQVSGANQLGALLRLAITSRAHPSTPTPLAAVRRVLGSSKGAILRELVPPAGKGPLAIVHVAPHPGIVDFRDELDAMALFDTREPPPALSNALSGPRVRQAIADGRLGAHVADAVRLLRREAFPRDDWTAMLRCLEDEIRTRSDQVGRQGWATTIDSLGPGISWRQAPGFAAIGLRKSLNERIQVSGSIALVPNLYLVDEPLVTAAGPDNRGVYYPMFGAPWTGRADRRDALGRLLGSTRAQVLDAVGRHPTTTEIAAALGLPVSTVGTHLRVLLDAGMVTRSRVGKSVRYQRVAAPLPGTFRPGSKP